MLTSFSVTENEDHFLLGNYYWVWAQFLDVADASSDNLLV